MSNNFITAKEEFFKLLPTIPILIATTGFINTAYYYESYQIDIFEYISPSEFLTFELKNTIFLSLVFLLLSPFFYAFKGKYYGVIKKLYDEPLFYNSIIITVAIALTAVEHYVFPVYKIFGIAKPDAIIMYSPPVIQVVSFVLFANATATIIIKINDKFEYPINMIYNIYTVFFGALIMIRLSGGFYYNYAITHILHNKYSSGSFLKTDKETIAIDSSNYLIGKTNNYYFIRNVKNNSNLIIPSDEIKSSKFIIKSE